MPAHRDLVGGQRDQRSARHRVVGHEDRDLGLVTTDRSGNLRCGEDQPPWRVKNDVQGNIVVGHMYGA
jgi:hypothetical protein